MSHTLSATTRRTGLGLATLSLAALALSAAHPAAAGSFGTTITANGASFTPGAGAISQLNSSGSLNGGRDYTDNSTPGQTFTTGSNSLGYLLNSLTLKGGGDAGGGYESGNFVVDISSVSGTTLTNLGTFTASALPLAGKASDFFTLDLSAASLTLASGTQYAYDIYGTAGYYGLARSPDNANPETYAGGSAFQGNQGSKTAPTSFTPFNGDQNVFGGNPSYDRTFSVGLTANEASAAPEASQVAVMGLALLGMAGLLIKAHKRKAGAAAN